MTTKIIVTCGCGYSLEVETAHEARFICTKHTMEPHTGSFPAATYRWVD